MRIGVAPAVRLFATLAVMVSAGTFVAAQVDFIRRHHPGLAPERYWLPQLTHIWLPGLGAAGLLALIAFALHRRRRAP